MAKKITPVVNAPYRVSQEERVLLNLLRMAGKIYRDDDDGAVTLKLLEELKHAFADVKHPLRHLLIPPG